MSYEEVRTQATEVTCDEEWGLGVPDSHRGRRIAAAAGQMHILVEEVVDPDYFDSLTGNEQVPFTD